MPRLRLAASWLAVALSTATLCFWAFHFTSIALCPAWYRGGFWRNAAGAFLLYGLPSLAVLLLAVLLLRWPRLIRPEPWRWAWRSLFILPTLAAVLAAAGLAWRSVPKKPLSEDRRISWSNIIWVPTQLNGENVRHAALLAGVKFEGSSTPYLMQLDTGTPVTVLYRALFPDFRRALRLTLDGAFLTGAAAGRQFQDEPIGFIGDVSPLSSVSVPGLIGSLGCSFFEHRILILDFVNQRLAILANGATLPAVLQQGIEYVPIEYRYGHVIVSAAIDGRHPTSLIFDTGSSVLPIFTGHRRWEELTHRQPGDPSNTTIRVNSWGREAALEGAPVAGTLCVGSACLAQPLAYRETSHLQNLDFDRYDFVASGILGNVLFDGRFTVIVDIAHLRLGLIRGALAGW